MHGVLIFDVISKTLDRVSCRRESACSFWSVCLWRGPTFGDEVAMAQFRSLCRFHSHQTERRFHSHHVAAILYLEPGASVPDTVGGNFELALRSFSASLQRHAHRPQS